VHILSNEVGLVLPLVV